MPSVLSEVSRADSDEAANIRFRKIPMKSLSNLIDRHELYKIDAARLTYLVAEQAFEDTKVYLALIEKEGCSAKISVALLGSVWQYVDGSFRFFKVLSQIRGLQHKDQRFVRLEKIFPKIVKIRNFIQHLDSGIPKLGDDVYPILGAVSWAAPDRRTSFTVALGALPKGTNFHSLPFDVEQRIYEDEIILNIDTFALKGKETFSALALAREYLDGWLFETKKLADEEFAPTFMSVGSIDIAQPGLKFTRIKFTAA